MKRQTGMFIIKKYNGFLFNKHLFLTSFFLFVEIRNRGNEMTTIIIKKFFFFYLINVFLISFLPFVGRN